MLDRGNKKSSDAFLNVASAGFDPGLGEISGGNSKNRKKKNSNASQAPMFNCIPDELELVMSELSLQRVPPFSRQTDLD